MCTICLFLAFVYKLPTYFEMHYEERLNCTDWARYEITATNLATNEKYRYSLKIVCAHNCSLSDFGSCLWYEILVFLPLINSVEDRWGLGDKLSYVNSFQPQKLTECGDRGGRIEYETAQTEEDSILCALI